MTSLWLAPDPLLLASRSHARRVLLEAAGIRISIQPAALDERELEARAAPEGPRAAASLLAGAKAAAVAMQHPGRYVLGADQTLALDDRRFHKAADRKAARAQLLALRGKTHLLHSAIAVVRDGQTVFEYVDTARMTMRNFSDAFLDRYIETMGDALTGSVGCYQLEAAGIQLFERIEGDYFTILGMPLLPLMRWLRNQGLLAA
jgi:septum formation protein